MKFIISVIMGIFSSALFAQKDTVASKVYVWDSLKISKEDTRERRQIAEGSGAALAYMEWHATSIAPGTSPHASHKHEEEELIIIKEGQVKVTLKDTSKVLGPGSIALFLPGDEHGLFNSQS